MASSRRSALRKKTTQKQKKEEAQKQEIAQMMRTQILITVELLSNFLVLYDDYKKPSEDNTLRKLGLQLLEVSENIQAKVTDDYKEEIAKRVDFIYNCWIDLGFIKVEDEKRVQEYLKNVLLGKI